MPQQPDPPGIGTDSIGARVKAASEQDVIQIECGAQRKLACELLAARIREEQSSLPFGPWWFEPTAVWVGFLLFGLLRQLEMLAGCLVALAAVLVYNRLVLPRLIQGQSAEINGRAEALIDAATAGQEFREIISRLRRDLTRAFPLWRYEIPLYLALTLAYVGVSGALLVAAGSSPDVVNSVAHWAVVPLLFLFAARSRRYIAFRQIMYELAVVIAREQGITIVDLLNGPAQPLSPAPSLATRLEQRLNLGSQLAWQVGMVALVCIVSVLWPAFLVGTLELAPYAMLPSMVLFAVVGYQAMRIGKGYRLLVRSALEHSDLHLRIADGRAWQRPALYSANAQSPPRLENIVAGIAEFLPRHIVLPRGAWPSYGLFLGYYGLLAVGLPLVRAFLLPTSFQQEVDPFLWLTLNFGLFVLPALLYFARRRIQSEELLGYLTADRDSQSPDHS